MLSMTRSKSTVVVSDFPDGGWTNRLAAAIDATVASSATDHEVISVAVTPVYAIHTSADQGLRGMELVRTAATSVIVTVVWREEADQPRVGAS